MKAKLYYEKDVEEIDVEEYDLANLYQVVFKVEK